LARDRAVASKSLSPRATASRSVSGRLYCSAAAPKQFAVEIRLECLRFDADEAD
jgi:hypothetical protein